MKKLIINADDFGLLPEVNEGIVTCFASGSLSSATLMVNGGAVEEAAALSRDMPGLKVGLHFTLTYGRPVSTPSSVSSLVEGDGRFLSRSQFERQMVLGRIRSSDVGRELRAQVRAFEALGLQMSHVDSHQHVHVFPSVFKVVSHYARERNLPLRIPWVSWAFAPGRWHWGMIRTMARKMLLKSLIQRSCRNPRGLRFPRQFLSVYDLIPFPKRITKAHYLRLMGMLQDTAEFMVHPARETVALRRRFTGAYVKEMELKVLRSFSMREEAARFGIRIASFEEV